MVPVLVYQGWWAFVSLSTLLLSLTVVQVAMKAALHDGLPYPYSLTAASQQTATGRTCCILSQGSTACDLGILRPSTCY